MSRSTLNRLLPLLVVVFLVAMFLGRTDIQAVVILPLLIVGGIWVFFVILSMVRNVRALSP